MIWTPAIVKQSLPNVSVDIGGDIILFRASRRENRNATLSRAGVSFQCSWKAIASSLNTGYPIIYRSSVL